MVLFLDLTVLKTTSNRGRQLPLFLHGCIMSKKQVLSVDAVQNKKTTMEYDQSADNFKIVTQQNIDPVKKMANEEMVSHTVGSMIGNTQKHHQKIAEIPTVIYYELLQKYGRPNQNPKAWLKWLQNSDNQAFRTTNGRLI